MADVLAFICIYWYFAQYKHKYLTLTVNVIVIMTMNDVVDVYCVMQSKTGTSKLKSSAAVTDL